MKPGALIYRSDLLPLSETFIAAQAGMLERYRPIFAGMRRIPAEAGLHWPARMPVVLPATTGRLLYRGAGFSMGLAAMARAQCPRLLHAHFALDAAEALPLARSLGIPMVVTLHGYDVMCTDEAHAATRRGRLYLRRRDRLCAQASLFICVSRAIREQALAHGFPQHKLRTLPVGIDIEAHPPAPTLPTSPLVLFVGRLVEKKGCQVLLRAMQCVQQELPEARLVIVGDGPQRAALEAQAEASTVGTRFFGMRNAAEVSALMRHARCLAAPSLTAENGDAEGLPTVLAEALAAGLPVASTFHSGIPELIRHNEQGLLAPEGSAETLAEHLLALCTDDVLAYRLRTAGRFRVERYFNLRQQTGLLERLYDEAIAAQNGAPGVVPSLAAAEDNAALPPARDLYFKDLYFKDEDEPHVSEQASREDAEVVTDTPPGQMVPRLRSQAVWLLSGNGASTVFQALYFLLMGRMLGSSEYGAFAGVVALVNIGTQFSSLGMEMVLLRTVARDRGDFRAAWARALLVSATGFLVLLASSVAYGHLFLPPPLRDLLPYLVFSDALFGKLTQLASRALQGADRARWSAKLLALTNAARAAAACTLFLICLHHDCGITALVWARVYLGASMLVAAVAFATVTRQLGWPARPRLRRPHLSEGLSFSFSSSAISVYNDIDKTMLIHYGMLSAAGIYAAAYRVIDVVSTPIYSLFAAASPALFRRGAAEGAGGAWKGTKALLQWAAPYGIVAVPLLALVAPVLPRLFGHSFAGSVTALRWLCLLPLLRALHYAWGTAITACTSQWLRTAVQASVALLNIALNVWLIPLLGWRGAAVTSVLSDGALAVASLVVLRMVQASQAKIPLAGGPAEWRWWRVPAR